MTLRNVNRFRGQGLRLSLPAGVAAAGAAMAESVQAAIQWSGATGQLNINIPVAQPSGKAPAATQIDLDGDGSNDFAFQSLVDPTTLNQSVSIYPQSPSGILNAVAVDKSSPKLFEKAIGIGENANWDFGGSQLLWSAAGDGVLGNRQSMANLGLRFTSNGGTETHYAWLQVSTDMQNPDVNNVYQNTLFTIVSWAYEDTPGASIPAAVPEPMSLVLVGGAATIMLTRRTQRRR